MFIDILGNVSCEFTAEKLLITIVAKLIINDKANMSPKLLRFIRHKQSIGEDRSHKSPIMLNTHFIKLPIKITRTTI